MKTLFVFCYSFCPPGLGECRQRAYVVCLCEYCEGESKRHTRTLVCGSNTNYASKKHSINGFSCRINTFVAFILGNIKRHNTWVLTLTRNYFQLFDKASMFFTQHFKKYKPENREREQGTVKSYAPTSFTAQTTHTQSRSHAQHMPTICSGLTHFPPFHRTSRKC